MLRKLTGILRQLSLLLPLIKPVWQKALAADAMVKVGGRNGKDFVTEQVGKASQAQKKRAAFRMKRSPFQDDLMMMLLNEPMNMTSTVSAQSVEIIRHSRCQLTTAMSPAV